MWKNYVARGRALLGWRRMACALAAKVAGSRAHGLQRLRKRTDGSDARGPERSILRGTEGVVCCNVMRRCTVWVVRLMKGGGSVSCLS